MHRTIRQATNHLIISIQSHVLAPALFYCIKTTRFKLLCATVVEPISSAWPVIATVTRWNPLACVVVDWSLCMCCSYLAMPAMLRVAWGLVHLGDGLEWNVYVCNETGCFIEADLKHWDLYVWFKIQLLPCIGPWNMTPLDFLFTLVLCPGVASSFWCL